MSNVKNIFLSFSNAVWYLTEMKFNPHELEGALFFLGCMREHTLKPDSVAWQYMGPGPKSFEAWRWIAVVSYAQSIIMTELRRGEREGRVVYRPNKPVFNYQRLNKLLMRNGLPALRFPTSEENPCFGKNHFYDFRKGRRMNFFLDGYSKHDAFCLIDTQLADLVKVVVA